MKTIAIVDYGMGNIDSVARAVEECGGKALVTAREEDLASCHGIILPGVGGFSAGMKNLKDRGLDRILSEQVLKQRISLLGICLGMQLMAQVGREGGETKGLGWIKAEVKLLQPSPSSLKIPHVGWNEVHHVKPSALWEGIASDKDFYFVHSYHVDCRDKVDILATVHYGGDFVCAIQKENIMGVQFHPEKSLTLGLKLISNFIALC